MFLADELQRLTEQWPHLPQPGDVAVPVPPTSAAYARSVPGVPGLEIIYTTGQMGIRFLAVRKR